MKNELLRHTLSTIEYRFRKSTRKCSEEFGDFSSGVESRTPKQIVNHMSYQMYATRVILTEGNMPSGKLDPISFEDEINRFNLELMKVDELLKDHEFGVNHAKKMMQGPFSDVLTHIGQISFIRRLAGEPILGEDFSQSPITTGIKN